MYSTSTWQCQAALHPGHRPGGKGVCLLPVFVGHQSGLCIPSSPQFLFFYHRLLLSSSTWTVTSTRRQSGCSLSLSLSVHFFLSLLVQNHNAPASPLPGGASVTTTVRVQVDILEDTVMFLHSQWNVTTFTLPHTLSPRDSARPWSLGPAVHTVTRGRTHTQGTPHTTCCHNAAKEVTALSKSQGIT